MNKTRELTQKLYLSEKCNNYTQTTKIDQAQPTPTSEAQIDEKDKINSEKYLEKMITDDGVEQSANDMICLSSK